MKKITMRQYVGIILVLLLTPQYLSGNRQLEPEITANHDLMMPNPVVNLPERIPTLMELLNVECTDDATIMDPRNRRVFKLGDLFGQNWPTEEQFTPGQRFMDYITRAWRARRMPQVRFSLREPPLRNIPGEHLSAAIGASKAFSLVLITGNPQSGKTRTLKQVGEYFEENRLPFESAVTVDLSTLLVSDNAQQPITLKDVIRASGMNPLFQGLFENIVELNPSATTILLDGIDRVPKATDRVLDLVADLHLKDVKLIMTANPDIHPRFSRHQITPVVIEIPSEISIFTTDELMTKRLLLAGRGEIFHNFDVTTDYGAALKLALQDIPLPRDFGFLDRLFQDIHRDVLKPFPNADDFHEVYDASTSVHETLKKSDHVKFDKFKFYNKFLQPWNADSDFYGPQALKDIFKSASESVKTEIQSHVESSNALLQAHGEESFKFLTYQDGVPDKFVHREYQRYFASKYIADSLSKESPLTNSFETIIRDPHQYKFILEFLNGAIRDPQYSETIGNKLKTLVSSNTEFVHKTLDNLIELKMDNLCSEMLQAIGFDRVKTYLEQPGITLELKAKYSLGMLADPTTTTDANYILRKSYLQYTGSRAEMVINLEMTESSKAWRNFGYMEDPSASLDYHAKKGITELNNFFEQNPGHKFSVESLNKAMFESIHSLGERSIEVMDRLWELGARPHDFQVDGRSLAHAAAEKCSKTLLQKVHEAYKVPLTSDVVIGENFGQSVLASALDSNPFPLKSRDGFWPMMEYLTEKLPLTDYANAINEYQPQIPDISERNTVFEASFVRSSILDAVDLIGWLVTVDELDVPREVTSLRRTTVIKHTQDVVNSEATSHKVVSIGESDHVTVTDVVLQHRGIDMLTATDKLAYKNTIKILIQREGNTFNGRQVERAYELIVRNQPRSELTEIRQFIQNVLDTLGSDVSSEHFSKFTHLYTLRENNRLDDIHDGRPATTDEVSRKILTTIYDQDIARSRQSGSIRQQVSFPNTDASGGYCVMQN